MSIDLKPGQVRRYAKRRKYEQQGRCYYCGETLQRGQMQLDHKTPKSRGGGKGDNLVLACSRCNEEKGCMNEQEYMEYRLAMQINKDLIK